MLISFYKLIVPWLRHTITFIFALRKTRKFSLRHLLMWIFSSFWWHEIEYFTVWALGFWNLIVKNLKDFFPGSKTSKFFWKPKRFFWNPIYFFYARLLTENHGFYRPKPIFRALRAILFFMLFYFFIFKVQTRNLMIQITQSVAQLMFIWWRTFPFPFSDSNAIKNCKIKNKHYYYYYKKYWVPKKILGF